MLRRGLGWGTALGLVLFGTSCARPGPRSDQPTDSTTAAPAAPPAGPAAQADPCDSATSQMAINACKAALAARSDSLELAQYDVATAWLKQRGATDRIPLLEASEQAWKAYREAQCKAEGGGYAGGSLAPTIIADCRTKLTRLRTEELRRAYAEPVTP